MRSSRRSEVRAALKWSRTALFRHRRASLPMRRQMGPIVFCAGTFAMWAIYALNLLRTTSKHLRLEPYLQTRHRQLAFRRVILPVVPLTVPPQRSVRVPRASDKVRRAVRGRVMRSYAVAACHAQRCALRRVPHRPTPSCDADPTTPFAGGRRGPSAEHLADEDAERTSRA